MPSKISDMTCILASHDRTVKVRNALKGWRRTMVAFDFHLLHSLQACVAVAMMLFENSHKLPELTFTPSRYMSIVVQYWICRHDRLHHSSREFLKMWG